MTQTESVVSIATPMLGIGCEVSGAPDGLRNQNALPEARRARMFAPKVEATLSNRVGRAISVQNHERLAPPPLPQRRR